MAISTTILTLLPLANAVPGYLDHGKSLETSQDPWLFCGMWATGSRSSAQKLQSQLLACDDSLWGKSFTVSGTDDVKSGAPSPCIGLACDYVSPKDFHHTQFQLCNVRNLEHQSVHHIPCSCTHADHLRMDHMQSPRTAPKSLTGLRNSLMTVVPTLPVTDYQVSTSWAMAQTLVCHGLMHAVRRSAQAIQATAWASVLLLVEVSQWNQQMEPPVSSLCGFV